MQNLVESRLTIQPCILTCRHQWIQWKQPPPPPYPRDMLMLQRWQYCTCNFYLWPPFCVSKIFTKKPGVHRYYSSRQKKKKKFSASMIQTTVLPDCLPFCMENFRKFWQWEKIMQKKSFPENLKASSNRESYVWRREAWRLHWGLLYFSFLEQFVQMQCMLLCRQFHVVGLLWVTKIECLYKLSCIEWQHYACSCTL